jgi:hypothetical protein
MGLMTTKTKVSNSYVLHLGSITLLVFGLLTKYIFQSLASFEELCLALLLPQPSDN